MQYTRQRIMNYLETNHKATSVELSHVFDMTTANIRHHLAVLMEQGKVEVVGQTRSGNRGRPTLLYMPTKQAQTLSLDFLAEVLLEEIQSTRTTRQRENKLKRLAERLAAGVNIESNSIPIRLVAAMQRLNELQYQSHWEAHSEAPLVIFGRCPYASLLDNHPELCKIDTYLLEKLLGKPIEQIARYDRNPYGSQQCKFKIIFK